MAEAKPKALGECGAFDFQVTQAWKFYVPQLDKTYDSYEQMSAAIGRHEAAKVKIAKKAMQLPCVDSDGRIFVITGVHAVRRLAAALGIDLTEAGK